MKFEEIKNTIIELAKKHNIKHSSAFVYNYGYKIEFFDELEKICGPMETIMDGEYPPDGERDELQSVWFFSDHNVYISLSGTYSSWDEPDWQGFDEMIEVVEKEISFKVWHPK